MSLNRKPTGGSQRSVGTSSGRDYNDQTQANTLANRRPSTDHNALSSTNRQRPITAYQSLIPPPSPTYFRMSQMNPHRASTQAAPRPPPVLSNVALNANPELSHLRPLEITPVKAEEPYSWHQKISIWMINEGNRAIFFGVWIFVHIGLFGLAFFNYWYSDNFEKTRSIVGVTLPIARGAALVLHVDSGVILLPVCRTLISWLRSTPLNRVVPFDKSITFHKAIAWSIVIFSVVHTLAHYVNYYKLSRAAPDKYNFWNLMFLSGPGWTGHVMLVILLIIVCTALPSVRMKKFEVFWYWHHTFLLFFFFFSFHGAYCLIPPDRPPYCKDISSFWKYWVMSGLIYLTERVMREWRARQKTVISRVILHPSKVVEIQIKKDNCHALAGQYIFLCCPEVSLWQWHPFTLTSAPEEDHVSIHMRVVGDFTKELSKKLGCDGQGVSEWEESLGDRNGLVTVLPRIMIDGPFGAASEDVFKYEVTVLFGAGIGVTPFASILKSIWYRVNYPTKPTKLHKVYFFWVCRDKDSFEWFQSLLLALESQDLNHFIEIHTFLTGRLRHSEVGNLMINDNGAYADTVTGLRAKTQFGRPNLHNEFDRIRESHPDTDIGVFFCGPKKMGHQLHACCTKFSGNGTSFVWHKENF